MKHHLICINCPMGCAMEVEMEGDTILSIAGNTCPRGKAYAQSEVTHPVRMVTTSLPVINGTLSMVSCKLDRPVDKDKIFAVMKALQGLQVQAPVAIGDILTGYVADTGANVIASRAVPAKQA